MKGDDIAVWKVGEVDDEMCSSKKLYSHWTGADRQG